MWKVIIGICTIVLILSGCKDVDAEDVKTEGTSVSLAQFAKTVGVKYQVETNRADNNCDKTQTQGLCFSGSLSFRSVELFTDKNWTIYFSHMSPIQTVQSEQFVIKHINGDLHALSPTAAFAGFQPNQVYTIGFRAGFWHLSQYDIMPNYYIVGDDGIPHVLTSTKPIISEETGLELLPHSMPLTQQDHHFKRTLNDKTKPATAQWLFEQNAGSDKVVDVSLSVLPTPNKLELRDQDSHLDLAKGINLALDGVSRTAVQPALDRLAQFGIKQSKSGTPISITVQQGLPSEGYSLVISEKGITITASDPAGAFYSLQTITSLLMPNSTQLPLVYIEDAPRFEYRGLHVDVSRNFKSKQFILQLLEQMSAYKLNKFHFQIGDDEGWRIEIPGLPELTEVGAFRCHDLSELSCLLPQLGAGPFKTAAVNGYYTVADYKEILAYANARHIQVIPSMDMPGHSRAAVVAMKARYHNLMAAGDYTKAKQYLLHNMEDSTVYQSVQFYNDNTINACMDSSYDFIAKVIDELAIMHQQAGQPLVRYHIGADETAGAWIDSSACKTLLENNVLGIESAEDIAAYFIERVSRLLAERNIEVGGWNDGLGHTKAERMPEVVQSNAWTPLMWNGHTSAHEQANRGWQVVVSSPDVLYFDFPYEADANERGYYWASRRTNSKKLFSFMPENLPANAEFLYDREERPYVMDDRLQTDENGNVTHAPLNKGVKFAGMQGQLWTETVRTDQQASYMLYPRLYALAERAWHKANWELDYDYNGKRYGYDTSHITLEQKQERDRDWLRFANHIGQKALPKAELSKVFYRLPTVGAKIDNGLLHANSAFPGLAIEYKAEDKSWLRYTQPISVQGDVQIRAISADGTRVGRSLTIKPTAGNDSQVLE